MNLSRLLFAQTVPLGSDVAFPHESPHLFGRSGRKEGRLSLRDPTVPTSMSPLSPDGGGTQVDRSRATGRKGSDPLSRLDEMLETRVWGGCRVLH